MNLRAVVRHYRMNHARNSEAELDSFRRETTLSAAVARAAIAKTPDGRRYSHQHRLKEADLAEAAKVLGRSFERLEEVTNFAKLHALLCAALGSRKGLGELYLYDTALRIGAKL